MPGLDKIGLTVLIFPHNYSQTSENLAYGAFTLNVLTLTHAYVATIYKYKRPPSSNK